MSNKPRSPFPLSYISDLVVSPFPKKAESAVCFSVYFTAVNFKALGNRRLQLCDSPCRLRIDIRACASTSMHDESAVVHTGFGDLKKIRVQHLSSHSQ